MGNVSRILFVAPDADAMVLFRRVAQASLNVLTVEGARFTSEDLLRYARASGIDVIVARAGRVDELRSLQAEMPVIEISVTGGDLVLALERARGIARDVAVLAHRSMLHGVDKLASVLDIRMRLVQSYETDSTLDSIFAALERQAGVIVGDAPVVRVCQENAIPSVLIPVSEEALRYALKQAMDQARCIALQREQRGVVDAAGHGDASLYAFHDIIGHSPAFVACRERAVRFARSSAPVFIAGETGVGKELFAQAMHSEGARAAHPFVAVNMATLPAGLAESELFGYVRGAFTDARREGRSGLFAQAGEGTLFLDEICEAAPDIQARLLRVLQQGAYTRLGDTRSQTARCRIIAATNREPEYEMSNGQLRPDLFFRLNVLALRVPSLRERRQDIPLLAQTLLDRHAAPLGLHPRIEDAALELLSDYSWPGNVRELEGVLERLLVLSPDACIRARAVAEELEFPLCSSVVPEVPDLSAIRVRAALAAHKGNMTCAARQLGIHRTTLWRWMRRQQSGERE